MKKAILIIIGLLLIGGAIFGVYYLDQNKTYNVMFETEGGTEIENIKVKKNATFDLPDVPTKKGYVFAYWTLEDDEPVLSGFPVKEDVLLYAKWIDENVEIATIVFDTDGGNQINSLKIEKGKNITLPDAPTKKGYKFVKWETTDGTPVNTGDTVNTDGVVTLKAVWEEVKEETKEEKPNNNKNTSNTSDKKPTTTNTSNKKPSSNNPNTIYVSSITLNQSNLYNMGVGDKTKLTATVKPDNATNKEISWSSSNNSVVSVDQNGNVYANRVGSAVITVESVDGKARTTINVTVINVPVQSIRFNVGSSYRLPVNSSYTLSVTISPSNATDKGIRWSSSNSNIISVDSNGKITARKIGTATITAVSNDGRAGTSIQVTSNINSIKITSSSNYVSKYGNIRNATLTVTTVPSIDLDSNGFNYTYTTSSGTFTRKNANTFLFEPFGVSSMAQATLTVSVGSLTQKYTINVEPKLQLIVESGRTITSSNQTVYYYKNNSNSTLSLNTNNIPVVWSITDNCSGGISGGSYTTGYTSNCYYLGNKLYVGITSHAGQNISGISIYNRY